MLYHLLRSDSYYLCEVTTDLKLTVSQSDGSSLCLIGAAACPVVANGVR